MNSEKKSKSLAPAERDLATLSSAASVEEQRALPMLLGESRPAWIALAKAAAKNRDQEERQRRQATLSSHYREARELSPSPKRPRFDPLPFFPRTFPERSKRREGRWVGAACLAGGGLVAGLMLEVPSLAVLGVIASVFLLLASSQRPPKPLSRIKRSNPNPQVKSELKFVRGPEDLPAEQRLAWERYVNSDREWYEVPEAVERLESELSRAMLSTGRAPRWSRSERFPPELPCPHRWNRWERLPRTERLIYFRVCSLCGGGEQCDAMSHNGP